VSTVWNEEKGNRRPCLFARKEKGKKGEKEILWEEGEKLHWREVTIELILSSNTLGPANRGKKEKKETCIPPLRGEGGSSIKKGNKLPSSLHGRKGRGEREAFLGLPQRTEPPAGLFRKGGGEKRVPVLKKGRHRKKQDWPHTKRGKRTRRFSDPGEKKNREKGLVPLRPFFGEEKKVPVQRRQNHLEKGRVKKSVFIFSFA